MKKLLSIVLTLTSFGFIGSLATPTAQANPQFRIFVGNRRHRDRDDRWRYRNMYNNGYQTTTQTRLVQRGWHTYQETYQVTYLPDGRVRTNLISRYRVN
jgi:hypothetical protein